MREAEFVHLVVEHGDDGNDPSEDGPDGKILTEVLERGKKTVKKGGSVIYSYRLMHVDMNVYNDAVWRSSGCEPSSVEFRPQQPPTPPKPPHPPTCVQQCWFHVRKKKGPWCLAIFCLRARVSLSGGSGVCGDRNSSLRPLSTKPTLTFCR